MRRIMRSLVVLGAIGLGACVGGWATPEPVLEGNGVHASDGATVVTAEELHTYGGSVLRAIMGKVPNMKVDFVGLQRCPAITMRRDKDLYGNNFPDVYVDGTRTRSTCVLESIQAIDTDRIEIYPQGFTKRPGYATSTHGLILIFTRRTGG